MTHKEYLRLLSLLQRYNYEYHTLDAPSVSDAVYDDLLIKIKEFETANPHKTATHSPTQRAGAKPSDKFPRVKHSQPMRSLSDVFSFEEVVKWEERLEKLVPDESWQYFIDIKMDGLALAVIYEDGSFRSAVTRGDGVVGEDVTTNAKTIRNLPLKLTAPKKFAKYLKGRLEIRGEVILYESEFKQINAEARQQGQEAYANSRNLAAGTMRQLDPKIANSRRLVFKAYDALGHSFATHEEVYQLFEALNFSHNAQAGVCANLATLQTKLERLASTRHDLPFNTDGLVIKVDDRDIFSRLGSVGKGPRAALAYKYPPLQATTVIEDIVLQIGRTGAATPVAVLKPVFLAGSTISHASLHNADEIERLDVRLGDTVIVFKAGDVIPKIEGVIKDLRPAKTSPFNFSAELARQYPGLKFHRPPGEVAYRLADLNSAVDELLILALTHYGARVAVDIDGLGEANSRLLVSSGLVDSLAGLYILKVEDLMPLERFADLSSKNLIGAITASKRPPLNRFIFGLGISHVGIRKATDLAGYFKTWAAFLKASQEDIEALEGIGEKTAKEIIGWLNSAANRQLFKKFAAVGVRPQPMEISGGSLAGKNLVLTGTFEGYDREAAREQVTAAGGRLQSQISATTDYLVVGRNPGRSKLDKAAAAGIQAVSEADFKQLLSSDGRAGNSH